MGKRFVSYGNLIPQDTITLKKSVLYGKVKESQLNSLRRKLNSLQRDLSVPNVVVGPGFNAHVENSIVAVETVMGHAENAAGLVH